MINATAKYVRVSPRKAGDVAAMIRGKKVAEAKAILALSTRGAAKLVGKVRRQNGDLRQIFGGRINVHCGIREEVSAVLDNHNVNPCSEPSTMASMVDLQRRADDIGVVMR